MKETSDAPFQAHTELLIIKSDQGYVRVKDGGYETGPMERASVFPISRLSEVRTHEKILREQYAMTTHLFKLTLIEEPFEPAKEG